jgi:nucleotide-binding universal stress UspA family protein
MANITRILCPVDFSDTSKQALAQALVIAGRYRAHVTILHVRPDGGGMEAIERRGREDELVCLTAGAPDVGVTVRFETGQAVTAIVECAATIGADLIVMGSHGTNGFERFLLGSVTDDVLRKAGCPVLVVPPCPDVTSRLPFKHVLCPVDFSPASRAGLALACSIAQEADAKLTLLHVLDLPPENELITSGPFAYPECRDQRVCEAHIALECLIPRDLPLTRPPVTLVSVGNPYREVLRVAAEQSVDLIVSGVHGRKPWDLLIFGSTTNQVIRRASCPVLSVRL